MGLRIKERCAVDCSGRRLVPCYTYHAKGYAPCVYCRATVSSGVEIIAMYGLPLGILKNATIGISVPLTFVPVCEVCLTRQFQKTSMGRTLHRWL